MVGIVYFISLAVNQPDWRWPRKAPSGPRALTDAPDIRLTTLLFVLHAPRKRLMQSLATTVRRCLCCVPRELIGSHPCRADQYRLPVPALVADLREYRAPRSH